MDERVYDVEVTLDPGWGLWNLVYVPELDTAGQAPRSEGEAGVERVAREIISLYLNIAEDSFGVSIYPISHEYAEARAKRWVAPFGDACACVACSIAKDDRAQRRFETFWKLNKHVGRAAKVVAIVGGFVLLLTLWAHHA